MTKAGEGGETDEERACHAPRRSAVCACVCVCMWVEASEAHSEQTQKVERERRGGEKGVSRETQRSLSAKGEGEKRGNRKEERGNTKEGREEEEDERGKAPPFLPPLPLPPFDGTTGFLWRPTLLRYQASQEVALFSCIHRHTGTHMHIDIDIYAPREGERKKGEELRRNHTSVLLPIPVRPLAVVVAVFYCGCCPSLACLLSF